MQKPEYKHRLEKGLVIMKKIEDQGYCWVRKDGGAWLKLVSVLQVAKFVKLRYATIYQQYRNTKLQVLKKSSVGTGPRSVLGILGMRLLRNI